MTSVDTRSVVLFTEGTAEVRRVDITPVSLVFPSGPSRVTQKSPGHPELVLCEVTWGLCASERLESLH